LDGYLAIAFVRRGRHCLARRELPARRVPIRRSLGVLNDISDFPATPTAGFVDGSQQEKARRIQTAAVKNIRVRDRLCRPQEQAASALRLRLQMDGSRGRDAIGEVPNSAVGPYVNSLLRGTQDHKNEGPWSQSNRGDPIYGKACSPNRNTIQWGNRRMGGQATPRGGDEGQRRPRPVFRHGQYALGPGPSRPKGHKVHREHAARCWDEQASLGNSTFGLVSDAGQSFKGQGDRADNGAGGATPFTAGSRPPVRHSAGRANDG